MSEVLRAIFQQNCLDSRPAFYSAQFQSTLPGVALTYTTLTTSIPCKSDTWFMVMGASFDAGFTATGGPYQWENKAASFSFELIRASNGQHYSFGVVQQVLQNYNLNNWVTYDEYIVFAPAELIQVRANLLTDSPTGIVEQEYSFVTLSGVEFQMPPGKGKSYGYA